MYRVTKDGRTMNLRDKTQLSAFVNAGWTKAEVPASAPAPSTENAAPVQTEGAPDGTRYTKTDINRMGVPDLQKLGAEMGIDGAADKSGIALKTEIIGKLGL